ncbi:DUF262 domain-containing protein [Citrobacter freundii]|uniref:DUF262 domain-containing protein n=1 Tax=Citrobacter freundii TaxID=546 RepID=UPI0015EAE020|nr:DUF262 domain-containing protein [Citrobacter freundii]QLX26181.1 DUF262 domain-containing protein [Citrobacter freundii]
MLINSGYYSIAELVDMLSRRDLVVNSNYQRAAGIWPDGPSSYFIDTILEGFPFPKIYLYEYMNRTERKIKKEIVDGQQRITTIRRYIDNQFRVKGDSEYSGLLFRELPIEIQEQFLSYTVSADVIRNATRSEILQMFRRMNAYTLPLNNAEKRHSSFIGQFKWFINETSDSLNEFFIEFGVFTDRQIIRMGEAEFISDCIIACERGLVSASPTDLNKLYQQYDDDFQNRDIYHQMLTDTFAFISTNFGTLRNSFMMKPYALHSLVTALFHNRYGIPSITNQYRIQPLGIYTTDITLSAQRLEALAQAHEAKDISGPYQKYVWGTESSTNKILRREARVLTILAALGCHIGDDQYDSIF